MTALVIAEHDNASIKGATLNTVTAAAKIGGGVHVLAREQQPLGARHADEAGQQGGMDHAGDAHLHLGHAEHGAAGSQPQVAGQRHLQPAAQAPACAAGHHRGREAAQRLAQGP